MSQTMNLKAMVEQISNQLDISDHHESPRYLSVIENSETRVFTTLQEDHFLIPVEKEEETEQERLDSLFVRISKFPGLGTGRFMIIRTARSRREVFIPFIAEFLMKDKADPIDSLEETLEEWKQLWMGVGGRLSTRNQRGLLGELIILRKLILAGGPKSAERWGGPLDWVHDFESDNLHIEVKTTTTQPPSVHISMVKQVAPMVGDKELHLAVVVLEHGDELSLKSEVMNIRKILSDTQYINHFEHVLRRSGYRDQHSSFYTRKYTISYVRTHEITEDSPVLKTTLLADIPHTVVNLRYNLEVHAMDMQETDDSTWKEFASLI